MNQLRNVLRIGSFRFKRKAAALAGDFGSCFQYSGWRDSPADADSSARREESGSGKRAGTQAGNGATVAKQEPQGNSHKSKDWKQA
jgi:hypothetical protein